MGNNGRVPTRFCADCRGQLSNYAAVNRKVLCYECGRKRKRRSAEGREQERKKARENYSKKRLRATRGNCVHCDRYNPFPGLLCPSCKYRAHKNRDRHRRKKRAGVLALRIEELDRKIKKYLEGEEDGNGREDPRRELEQEFPDFQPTSALPGSEEKVKVLEQRYEDGYPLWHPLDYTESVSRPVLPRGRLTLQGKRHT